MAYTLEAGEHMAVMLKETVDILGVKPGGRYIDGTLGRAGHAAEIARRGGIVLGIDRDDAAIEAVKARKIENLKPVKGRHGDIAAIASKYGWEEIDGILLDLGVSSPQLDEAGRGFSFMREGPLDMRMDLSAGLTAAEIVNTWSAERLEEVFSAYGEEPGARRLARAIVAERVPRPFATTMDLARFVERRTGVRGARHGATRVFQALRMAVNDELGELKRALEDGVRILAPGGRFAIITFESITDRTVKTCFASHVGRMESLQGGGERWAGRLPRARSLARKPVTASPAEVAANPRARSAKLRAIEICQPSPPGEDEKIFSTTKTFTNPRRI